jgi:hypothetical protein
MLTLSVLCLPPKGAHKFSPSLMAPPTGLRH